MSRAFSLAGFEVTLIGRFWVTTEALEESRYYLILAKDLGYGDTGSLTPLLEEVSRLLNAYASAILASES